MHTFAQKQFLLRVPATLGFVIKLVFTGFYSYSNSSSSEQKHTTDSTWHDMDQQLVELPSAAVFCWSDGCGGSSPTLLSILEVSAQVSEGPSIAFQSG